MRLLAFNFMLTSWERLKSTSSPFSNELIIEQIKFFTHVKATSWGEGKTLNSEPEEYCSGESGAHLCTILLPSAHHKSMTSSKQAFTTISKIIHVGHLLNFTLVNSCHWISDWIHTHTYISVCIVLVKACWTYHISTQINIYRCIE